MADGALAAVVVLCVVALAVYLFVPASLPTSVLVFLPVERAPAVRAGVVTPSFSGRGFLASLRLAAGNPVRKNMGEKGRISAVGLDAVNRVRFAHADDQYRVSM